MEKSTINQSKHSKANVLQPSTSTFQNIPAYLQIYATCLAQTTRSLPNQHTRHFFPGVCKIVGGFWL